jgi:hypothetical protein
MVDQLLDSLPEPSGEGAECEQGALFTLEGPDDDGCVWLVSGDGPSAIVVNLGPREPVATRLAEWLAEIDFGEGSQDGGD